MGATMFCARCGAEVGRDEKQCPGCGADLWGSGALRMTRPTGQAQSLRDVFGDKTVHDVPNRRSTPPRPEADASTSHTPTPRAEPAARAAAQFKPAPARPSTAGEPVGTLREHADDRERAIAHQHAVRLAVMLLVAALVAVGAAWGAWRMIKSTFHSPAAPVSAAPSPKPSAVKPSSKAPSPSPKPSPSAGPTRTVSGTLPATAKKCSATVAASEGASCGFAKAVAAKLPAVPQGTFTVEATSPTTGGTYTMQCTAGAITVCSGGRSAVVYVLK